MDFYRILAKELKEKGEIVGMELYPDFIVGRSKDLMIQGKAFYAIWDEEAGLWSRDEYDVQRLVDADLDQEAEAIEAKLGFKPTVKRMGSFGSNSWAQFRKYIAHISDSYHTLDAKLVWANTEVKKTDYASKKLPYAIGEGGIEAWSELLSVLYSPEERMKIEWAIGSIVSGESKRIQKFFVFYGPPGTGKSTVLEIIQQLFEGYTTAFDGKALGSSNAAFATEVFKHNPLVAIQHDGDLSRLEDNARLNSIISHEEMTMNEKYKPSYSSRVDALLFVGSNQPVRISDAKSGIIRRLVDIHPTGVKIPVRRYQQLVQQVQFELGAIAQHCLGVFEEHGRNFYGAYRPLEMMLQTDVFFNFIEAHYDVFKDQGYTTLKQAYALYKEFCDETGVNRPLPQYKMREELRNYFDEFKDRGDLDGEVVRSLYMGFNADKFKTPSKRASDAGTFTLVMEETESLLDFDLAGQPAQLAKADGTPKSTWSKVSSTLADLDTAQLHYVQVPDNHIVIDFDLKDENGTKALERNLEAASVWPPTYAEVSRSGEGVHLHYVYTGSTSELSPEYSDGIEVKVYTGSSSLRRLLSRCNAVPVAEISSGLPLKEPKEKMLRTKTMTTEKGLRDLIQRNLDKEIHPGTKSSVDFIAKVLQDAYESDMRYDVTDLRPQIIAFANNSTNQASAALSVVQGMKWASEEEVEGSDAVEVSDSRIVFFDVEVYPNLFVICWKFIGDDNMVRMINPKPHEVEALFKLKLVGFYNRRYDNHILYAAAMGASPEELFRMSNKMVVENNRNATFAAAYSLSYADIWDFSSVKQSLKKFELDLGILHMELDIPWDQPVPENKWPQVVEYCVNDVRATEAVFEDRKSDFVARQILAELSGLTVNDTTQKHTAKIVFGDKMKTANKEFDYTDLSELFPGYKFELGKSTFMDEDPSEGGYVYAEPGMYENVAVLDVASMHPTSIIELNAFGPYTPKFKDLMDARLAIKRKDFESARSMLDGRLKPFLEDEDSADKLSYALKIVINIVYGLTSAKFDNPFRDLRNVDNIVAKRGALFMIQLKHELQAQGVKVVHIKTDSIKIAGATPDVISMVLARGRDYGYTFEHESTYDRFCLVNDAVYVAAELPVPWEDPYPKLEWKTVGAQFQHPYVFKTLFSGEELEFDDYVEGKTVIQGRMYLDMDDLEEPDASKMRHVGKTGSFVPVLDKGGILYRVKDDRYYAVNGTKGHRWLEAEIAARTEVDIDMSYFEKLAETAVAAISQFGDFDKFTRKEQ